MDMVCVLQGLTSLSVLMCPHFPHLMHLTLRTLKQNQKNAKLICKKIEFFCERHYCVIGWPRKIDVHKKY